MKSIHKKNFYAVWRNSVILLMLSISVWLASCKKLIEVPAPVTNMNAVNVYTSDATAVAVLTDIYANLSDQNSNIPGEGLPSLSILTSLSSDELTLYNLNNSSLLAFYTNDLTKLTIPNFWNGIYPIIFVTNAAIEGLNGSSSLTPAVKQQLLGEAKFIRAFCYFYLANLYGDVPLPTTTDYKVNSLLSRMPKSKVYDQIITDLHEAQNLLNEDYVAADVLAQTQDRVRPTKWAATALLARLYLYKEDYANTEIQASNVISHSPLYKLPTLNNVFLKNSMEAIWQLQPVGFWENSNTGEGKVFVLPIEGPNNTFNPVYLSSSLVNSFETGDQRKTNWVNNVTVNGVTYYYPYKYKIGRIDIPTAEYVMVLRLGEQYLIRAEARAQLNNITGATADLNVIRNRAGLPNTTASTIPALLTAILQERKVELFTEWGHRWLDLKRSNTIDAIMSVVTSQKGGIWNTTDQLYPIPFTDLERGVNLIQNPGY